MLAQNPKILVITPPPVNEYQLVPANASNPDPTRTASNTRLYAEAAREVAGSLGVPVVDIWTRFMEAAGWQVGQPLPGSREIPNNDKLQNLFVDGSSYVFLCHLWFCTD